MCQNERFQPVEICQNERFQRVEIYQTADISTNTEMSIDCIVSKKIIGYTISDLNYEHKGEEKF